ncbi:MAG: hypothetical protein HYX92_16385 [Chloroflexi bacterium]|nr:hypothetical protein [Chloroflexota bacterium]
MKEMKYVQHWINRLYAELAELKCYTVRHATTNAEQSCAAWRGLMDASAQISAAWSGPGAVEEIRAQREK